MKNIVVLLLFFVGFQAKAVTSADKFHLFSDPKKYTKEQYREIIRFMDSVEALVPEKMKSVLARGIFVDFADTGGSQLIYPQCDLSVENLKQKADTVILGHVENGLFTNAKSISGLSVNKNFLKDIYAGPAAPKRFTCGHKDAYRMAQSVVLHELAHLYDFMETKVGEEADVKKACEALEREERDRDIKCRFQAGNRKSVSGSMTYLNAAGWTEKGLIIKKRKNLNLALDRSPDVYEYKNPLESFAVNFEYFIMDPDFKCRRPTMYDELRRHFDFAPNANVPCTTSTDVYLSTAQMDPQTNYAVDIDPSRVYEVDYLFASEGEAFMSRWGHAMYRLILCAPGKPKGPSCRQDVAYHVVVSYRAMVTDLQIDSRKGLNGDYPSRLFILTMNDTVDEYTKGELRNVISLPMKMTTEERTLFVQRILEQYWSYRGSYYFLSNNCATEAVSLTYASKKDLQHQMMTADDPLELYRNYIKLGMVNPKLLDNKKNAKDQTYFFPAHTEKLYKAFGALQAEGPAKFKSYKDARDYLFNSRATDRRALFQALWSDKYNRDTQRRMTAYLVQLEEHIQRVTEAQFGKVVADRFAKVQKDTSGKTKQMSDGAIKMLKLTEIVMPENRAAKAYGVPLKTEIKPLSEGEKKYISDTLQTLTDGIKTWAFNEFPQEIEEMKHVMENRNELAKNLIDLSKRAK
ncbi:DUF4105 domain-containing protein [Bdellovibrio sp. HCB337]|uniref:DUF7844 domain-containing protein n=1 Tax=Bdellovibrio sp. HCB337 TaxID=3394358 RepID=UPI0039A73704